MNFDLFQKCIDWVNEDGQERHVKAEISTLGAGDSRIWIYDFGAMWGCTVRSERDIPTPLEIRERRKEVLREQLAALEGGDA